MSEWDDDNLAKWLDAEDGDARDEADRLFAAVASSRLRRLEAPSGLTTRIMALLPGGVLVAARPAFDPVSSWWIRVIAIAAVVLLGLGFSLVTPHGVIDLAVETAGVAIRLGRDVVASLGAAFGLWKTSLHLLAVVGQAAALASTTGPLSILIAVNLAVASVAFVGLRRLLAPREECF